MDASDAIRKLQNKTVFAYYKVAKLSTEALCNYSTCSSLTNCTTKFPDYAERQQVFDGRQLCNNCSNSGCGCGS